MNKIKVYTTTSFLQKVAKDNKHGFYIKFEGAMHEF